jgi:aspartyl-tRNA(Asn)/glutamyl-tRNA(Gln) amidotransferase subunit A
VVDAARYLDCTAGPDESDPRSSVPPVGSFEASLAAPLPAGLRVAWAPQLGSMPAEEEVEAVVAAAADTLVAAAGLDRRDVTPRFPEIDDGGASILAALAFADRSPDPDTQAKLPEIFMDLMQTPGAQPVMEMLAAGAMSPTLDRLIEANHHRFALNEALAEVFHEVDVVLTPTMPFPAFPAEGPIPTMVRGREAGMGTLAAFTMPFNASGHPAVSVPAGLVGGLPVGLQIVCRRHEDHLALALAQCFERTQPWPLLAPGY